MKRAVTMGLAGLLVASCGPPTTTNTDLCKGRMAGDLVITELMVDPDGTDTGAEWVEVFNSLGTPLDLKGMTIYTRDTDGTGLKTHPIRAGVVPARSYFVLGDVRSGPNPAWVNYSYADGLGSFGNTRGVVGVRCGTLTIDEMQYTRAAKSMRARMLNGNRDPSATENDQEGNWCDAPVGNIYFGTNNGTPGQANPECAPEAMLGTCVDNGTVRPISPPGEGDLVITEIMARPATATSTNGEWFEALARASVDLNDVSISSGTSTDTITSMQCLRVNAGDYVLFARSADAFLNGDLPPPKVTYSVSWSDNNERVRLSRGDAGIDEAAIYASASGKSWQLDPNRLDPLSNDSPDNFCRAPNKWNPDGGGDFGSPGAANPTCPETDAGMMTDPDNCIDPMTMAVRPVRRPNPGDVVITEWMADPSAVADTAGEWFEVLVKVDTDLNGIRMANEASTTLIQSQQCLPVTANSYVIFANNGNSMVNGGLPPVAATFSFGLANSGARSISLSLPDAGELDRIAYASATAGASTQLKPGFMDVMDNDNAANLCPTPTGTRYGTPLPDGGIMGDRGTPGLPNVTCP